MSDLNRWRCRYFSRQRGRRLIYWREKSPPLVTPRGHLVDKLLTKEG